MITNKELNEVSLSPTKKDYYQIWNELMELADKISERWSPASTNESDPGIVLLKALTAVADKLNYNIDKNTLEAFMPSATQEDSMRKLTEMMGYDMKHYQSATGKVTITYKSSNDTPLKDFAEGIYFPKFINLKNEDEDINYVTLEDFTLQAGQDSREVAIIEGEVLDCETNNDNIITILNLDDLNRYILPEYTIAENGIFITNIADSKESEPWRKEQNLNVQQPGTKVYKFGFDSKSRLPYVQFPEDIKTLIEDGLKIKYVRTNGLNGNIAAKVLSKLEKPALWATADEDNPVRNLSEDAFSVSNSSAANNGTDPESLTAAYNNYKKTIGTFDTLVTCRDYMNKIYQMTESDTDTTPLVSNIIVSDIRDDINRSTPICTFNEYGICYKDTSLKEPIILELPEESTGDIKTVKYNKNKIEHFDLVFYPFKTVYGLNNKIEYKNSFKYTAENLEKIKADLGLNKTIAHNIIDPRIGEAETDIACIKNYLKLKAKVTTTKKVTLIEESEILNNIYKALYTNFNAHQVDFGEEIPYESLVEVIKGADYRIKDINLDEPDLATKFCLLDNTEVALSDSTNTTEQANKIYNKLVLRNVLAGKISAFDYNNNFISEYDKTDYAGYESNYPNSTITSKIESITSSFDVGTAYAERDKTKEPDGLVLKENEVIQFRVPNFKTTKTYPAYVNYFIKLNSMGGKGAIPATFISLGKYMEEKSDRWESFIKKGIENELFELETETSIVSTKETVEDQENEKEEKFKTAKSNRVVLFTKTASDEYKVAKSYASNTTYYYLNITDDLFVAFNNWIKEQDSEEKIGEDEQTGESVYAKLLGIYKTTGVQEKPFGRLIDTAQKKYLPAYKFGVVASNREALDNFYVQVTRAEEDSDVGTKDGLGRDANYIGVPKDGEYELKSGEYLLINYTDSKTDETGTERKSVINKIYPEKSTDTVVIRANFSLIDSLLHHNNHSYSKTDGFDFASKTPEGMFTLGTNEQIEIREVVKVKLDEPSMYLYWTLNSDDPEEPSEFKFEESYGTGTNNAYTLKEGEHLYYTNSKKQDLVYYGAGSTVVRKNPNLSLIKYATSGQVSEEEIMTYGLAAGIPWQVYDLSGSNSLEIIENQYISLTEGDTIVKLNGNELTSSMSLTNDWESVDSAEYRFAEDESNSTLPVMAVTNLKWEARSRLDFNMSKTTAQALHMGDCLKVKFENQSSIDLKPTEKIKVDGKDEIVPVYVNSNYTCQAAIDTLKVDVDNEDLALKLKISKVNTPKIANNENVALNNYINGEAKYTKFDFANLPKEFKEFNTDSPAFTLNISIPDDSFGLMLVYFIENTEGAQVKIKAKDEATVVSGLEFFNTGSNLADTLKLNPGINIIKVTKDVKQLEIYSDAPQKSSIIFGNLDLITGINPKLDYRNIDQTDDEGKTDDERKENARLKQLLKDIKELGIAKDFYYNIPITGSQDIDLNPLVETDLLSSPVAWYDLNNVNRKFVISEIDADYLPTGITIAKTSRA